MSKISEVTTSPSTTYFEEQEAVKKNDESQVVSQKTIIDTLNDSVNNGKPFDHAILSQKERAYCKALYDLVGTLSNTYLEVTQSGAKQQETVGQMNIANSQTYAANAEKVVASSNQLTQQNKDAKVDDIVGKVFGALLSLTILIASAGTMAPVAFGITAVMTVSTEVISSVPVKDGKTAAQLWAEQPGMSELGVQGILLAANVLTGSAAGMAEGVVRSGLRAAATVAVKEGAEEAAEIGANSATKSMVKNAPGDIEMTALNTAKTVAVDAGEDVAVGAGKSLKEAAKEAKDKVVKDLEELTEKVAKSKSKSEIAVDMIKKIVGSSKSALQDASQAMDSLIGQGIIAGVKKGLFDGLTQTNFIGASVSSIITRVDTDRKIRENGGRPLSKTEEADIKGHADEIGGYVQLGVSFAATVGYIGLPQKMGKLNGMDFYAGNQTSIMKNLSLEHSMMIQKVLTGVRVMATAGQAISSALLAVTLFHASDNLKTLAGLNAEKTKLDFSLNQMNDLGKKIRDNTAHNVEFMQQINQLGRTIKNMY